MRARARTSHAALLTANVARCRRCAEVTGTISSCAAAIGAGGVDPGEWEHLPHRSLLRSGGAVFLAVCLRLRLMQARVAGLAIWRNRPGPRLRVRRGERHSVGGRKRLLHLRRLELLRCAIHTFKTQPTESQRESTLVGRSRQSRAHDGNHEGLGRLYEIYHSQYAKSHKVDTSVNLGTS